MDRELHASGYDMICGVDEAGRGPLAGPVFAAAVILPPETGFNGLGDSKKLSEKTRGRLFDEITASALSFAVALADHREIDEMNILRATFLAMNRAVDKLAIEPDIVLVDGDRDPKIRYRSRCIVGGDGKSASIAAASILAKVSRDRHMAGMAELYPQYSFEKHKGYGTKLHYEKLREHGPSEIHRVTFLKKLPAAAGNTGAAKGNLGAWGEALACEYLEAKNYTIAAKGFRSPFGEIDLIVSDKSFIVFVEVKLRKKTDFAFPREFISRAKQKKIIATANLWLASHRTRLQPRFDVIEIYAPDGEKTASPEINHIENAFS